MNPRPCGACQMCCKLVAVHEIDKPAGEWCSQCKPGQGCLIYENRPESCRGYYCLWAVVDAIPEDQRPDRSRVILNFEGERLLIFVDPNNREAWQHGKTGKFIQNYMQTAKAAGLVIAGSMEANLSLK